MKNGYDQFFKNARKVANNQNGPRPRLQLDLPSEEAEQQIRHRLNIKVSKKKKKATVPWKLVGVSVVGLLVATWGFQNYEKVESIIQRVEFEMTGSALAQPEVPVADRKESKGDAATETPSADEERKISTTSIDVSHLKKLNERKKELDAREEELNRMESELQVQKVEMEKRLKELEDMRNKISTLLDDRVKADDSKVDTLVQMYSNMKAPQAAKVFETMDENLAVEILGRMKKKNAADIMNLLKPDKAQILSEMFAGYKRRTPASQ